MQKYKVFLNSKFLLITNREIIFDNCKKHTQLSNDIIDCFLNEDNVYNLQIIVSEPFDTFKEFLKRFEYIEAAGGLVENKKNEILFIYRLNHWDLPKGGIEEGELPTEAAIREVAEECGIFIDEIGDELDSTYHIYERNDKLWLKKTYWYKMQYNGSAKLVPQTEEDISKAIWVNKNNINEYSNKMFSGIIEILKVYL